MTGIPLLQRHLLFVTGKGGAGKSTAALALGLLAARRGHRTIVAEVSGGDRLRRTYQRDGRVFEEVELEPRLFTISIDPEHAMEEYLRVKVGPLGQAVGHTRLFQALTMATPGMRELLTIGKAWELAQPNRRTQNAAPYDLVIVDAPSTGHGAGILQTPRTFAEIARVGPIHNQGSAIAATIADRSFTGIIAVCTPEEMAVSETIALGQTLAGDGLELDAVILNARLDERFADEEQPALRSALAGATTVGDRTALRAALSQQARAVLHREQQLRLEHAYPAQLVTLPFVFTAALGPEQIGTLADALGDQLA